MQFLIEMARLLPISVSAILSGVFVGTSIGYITMKMSLNNAKNG